MAVAYHLLYFATINRAAYVFAALFLGQAALFVAWAVSNRSLEPRLRPDLRGVLGIAMLACPLIAYPVLRARLGHSCPSTPTFGVPCPTTIFTPGILTVARAPRIGLLIVVPLLWSVVGGSAAFLLVVWQDLGLLATGILAAAVFGIARRRAQPQTSGVYSANASNDEAARDRCLSELAVPAVERHPRACGR
jgi:hypothetical protein